MAYKATQSGSSSKENKDKDAPEFIDHNFFSAKVHLGCRMSSFGRSGSSRKQYSDAGSISTVITSPMSNRMPTKATPHSFPRNPGLDQYNSNSLYKGNKSNAPINHDEFGMHHVSAASASLEDDLSVSSSSTDVWHHELYWWCFWGPPIPLKTVTCWH